MSPVNEAIRCGKFVVYVFEYIYWQPQKQFFVWHDSSQHDLFHVSFDRQNSISFVRLNSPIQHIAIKLPFLCQSKLHRWKIDIELLFLSMLINVHIKNVFQSNDANNNMKIAFKYHKFTTLENLLILWVLSFERHIF